MTTTPDSEMVEDRIYGLKADFHVEVAFMFDRIGEMDWGEDTAERDRQWNGHVAPSIARFRMILNEIEAIAITPSPAELCTDWAIHALQTTERGE